MKKEIYLILSFLVLFLALPMLNASDCPLGLENDPYPGDCGKYIDTNQDKLCDYSQTITQENLKSESLQVPKYPFILLLIVVCGLYLLSYFLSTKKVISFMIHKKIWNILLLLSFLISGIGGIILIIKINYNIVFPEWFNLLFLHVEAGIIMTIISIFHILWHIAYFKSFVKKA